MFSLLLGIYLGVELLGHLVTVCLIVCGTARMFSTVAAPFFIITSVWDFQFVHIFVNTCYYLLGYSYPRRNGVVAHCGLNVHIPDG